MSDPRVARAWTRAPAPTPEALPTFGQVIRAEREALDMFRHDLAAALEYTDETVRLWECDLEVPMRPHLIRLAIDGLKYRHEVDPGVRSTETAALGVALEAAKRRARE